MTSIGRIPEATVARLPLYLRGLDAFPIGVAATVSSDELADLAGVNAAKLRKDLSYLGTYGIRGVGYDADFSALRDQPRAGRRQHLAHCPVRDGQPRSGACQPLRLHRARLPGRRRDRHRPRQGRSEVDGVPVYAPSELAPIVAEHEIAVGVIATPPEAAQGVADRLVEAGIKSIMSFAPIVLAVPDGVDLRAVDLAAELQILGFHLHRTRLTDAARDAVGGEWTPEAGV